MDEEYESAIMEIDKMPIRNIECYNLRLGILRGPK